MKKYHNIKKNLIQFLDYNEREHNTIKNSD